MQTDYHKTCPKPKHSQNNNKTSFGTAQTQQYARSYYKSDHSSIILLNSGSSVHTVSPNINPNFRIPRFARK